MKDFNFSRLTALGGLLVLASIAIVAAVAWTILADAFAGKNVRARSIKGLIFVFLIAVGGVFYALKFLLESFGFTIMRDEETELTSSDSEDSDTPIDE